MERCLWVALYARYWEANRLSLGREVESGLATAEAAELAKTFPMTGERVNARAAEAGPLLGARG
jgi:hypothetical protein